VAVLGHPDAGDFLSSSFSARTIVTQAASRAAIAHFYKGRSAGRDPRVFLVHAALPTNTCRPGNWRIVPTSRITANQTSRAMSTDACAVDNSVLSLFGDY